MKKTAYIILILISTLIWSGSRAQQLPQFTQYLLNDYVLNPAIAGSRPYFDAKANQRLQWVGITDAPRTFIFSLNGPLNNRKYGVGGYVFTDITGPTRRSGIRGSYSYHFQVASDLKLSLGISGGVLQFTVDGSKLNLQDQNDVALSNGMQSVLIPDAGAGAYLYNDDFFLSLSVPQLIGSKLQFFEDYTGTLSRLSQHYFAMAGYTFWINNEIGIQPSTLIKYVNPFLQVEGSLRVLYDELLWVGGNFRQNDGIGLVLGYNITDHIAFGYSYDIPFASYSRYSSGSHEVMLQMKFLDKE